MLHDKAPVLVFILGIPAMIGVVCYALGQELEKARSKRTAYLGVQLADSIRRYRMEHEEVR